MLWTGESALAAGARRRARQGLRFKDAKERETCVGGPRRPGCNVDVLVRCNGAQIDEWIFRPCQTERSGWI